MSASVKPTPTHLAKTPHSAVLVSWCGYEEKRTRKPQPIMGPIFARDGGEILRFGDFTCSTCRNRLVEEGARIQRLLAGTEIAPLLANIDAAHCGDNSCPTKLGGVGTNGGCQCEPRQLRQGVLAWRRYATHLQALSGLFQPLPTPGAEPCTR